MRSCFPTYLVVRVCAILLFMSGIIVGLVPAQKLLLVRPMNWEKSFVTRNPHWSRRFNELSAEEQAEKNEHNSLRAEYEAELNAYIEKKSQGRKIYVSGKSWLDLFDGLTRLDNGKKTSSAGSPPSGTNGYFSVERGIFASIKAQLQVNPGFFYVMIKDSDSNSSLAVEVQKSGEFLFKAPAPLVFPWLYQALWLVIIGLAIYGIQTTSSPSKERVRLSSDYLGRGSDVLASIMASFMIIIGSMIATNLSFTAFSQEWFMVVGGFTIFASVFASILIFTAYYQTLAIDYGDEKVIIGHLFGNTEIDSALIREVRKAEYFNPGWMKTLLKLGRLLARNRGEAKYYQDIVEPGFWLILSTGQSGPVMKFKDMHGITEFFDHLEQSGVKIDNSARILAAQSDDSR